MGCNNLECQFFFKWVALIAKFQQQNYDANPWHFKSFFCTIIRVKKTRVDIFS